MTFEVTKPEIEADRAVRKKVLIVEDNDLNMKLFNDLLVATGMVHCRPRMVSRRLRWPASTAPT